MSKPVEEIAHLVMVDKEDTSLSLRTHVKPSAIALVYTPIILIARQEAETGELTYSISGQGARSTPPGRNKKDLSQQGSR